MVSFAACSLLLRLVFRVSERVSGGNMNEQFWYFNANERFPVRFLLESEEEQDRLSPLFKDMGFEKSDKQDDQYKGRTIKILFTDVGNIRKLYGGTSIPLQDSGAEVVYKKLAHSVYVYKDFSTLIYSSQAREWNCYFNGNEQLWANIELNVLFKIVIGRILSLVFEKTSIVGFYGVPVKEGVVIMNAKEAKGEFVFFDVNNKVIYTQDGTKKFDLSNKILRLEASNSSYEKKMRKEELYSFLMARTMLLSLGVNNGYQINAVKLLTNLSDGVIFPERSFKARISVGI